MYYTIRMGRDTDTTYHFHNGPDYEVRVKAQFLSEGKVLSLDFIDKNNDCKLELYLHSETLAKFFNELTRIGLLVKEAEDDSVSTPVSNSVSSDTGAH